MSTGDDREKRSGWIIPLMVLLHGGAWGSLAAVFYFVVPRYKNVLEDFGSELPRSAIMLISISDLVVNFFYILVLPFGLLLVFDYYLLTAIRSPVSRLAWGLIGLLVPALLAGFVVMSLAVVVRQLTEAL